MKNLKKGLGQTFKRLEKVLKKDLEKGLGMTLKSLEEDMIRLGKGLGKTWKRLGKRLWRWTWIVLEKTWKKEFGNGLGKAWKKLGKDLEEDLERLRKGLYLGKTRKRIGKRPGKTWKITLPNKYIKIADSNSFYVQ